jgi:hypothetical protein
MGATVETINLTPIFNILLWLVSAIVVVSILLGVVGSVFDFLRGGDNELGAIIVFWGGIAIVVASIVLAFTHHIVAFE